MKRKISLFAMMCLFGSLQTAAGGAAVKLTVGHWTGGLETKIIEKLAEVYMARHPEVQVELVAAHGGPWGRDKYVTMFAANAAPDLLLLNTGNFELFANKGWLYPLDGLIAKDTAFRIDSFFPASIDGSSFRGKVYGLPYDVSNHVPYFNREMFDAQGVAAPGAWTWDDLLQAAKKLTRDKDGDGKVDVYGLGISRDEWQWDTYLVQSGARLFGPNGELRATDPAFVRFMEWYHGLMWEQEVAPFDPGGIWRFGSQGVAIAVFGPWYRPGLEAAQLKFRYDVAIPPKGARHATTYYVDQFAIAATTRYPQQAWSLLKFITGRDGWEVKMALGSGGRSVPPLKEFALSKNFLEYGGLQNRVFLDALAISEKPIAALPSGQGREFLDIWWQELDPAWKQKQPLRPLLENVQRRVHEKLGL